MFFFPDCVKSVYEGWAKYQGSDGMIQEEFAPGILHLYNLIIF
jgi:hypothetical protein